jgi:DNA-binding LacI/PurR family transcriptional regulator
METTKEKLPVLAKIHRELRQRVLQGVYPPHTYLPAERELARHLRASRVTISRALDALERDGLVVRSQGRGTRVLPDQDRTSQPLIAVVHDDLSGTARADTLEVLRGVKDTLQRLGKRQEMVFASGSQFLAGDVVSRFGAMVVVACGPVERELLELQARAFPIVMAKMEWDWNISATWVDHKAPVRQAVRTLADLGHERIAFVGREPEFGFHGKARAAYVEAMREAQLLFDESLTAVCEKTDALSGYLAAKPLIRRDGGSDGVAPTAIVAARDSIAEGVCRAITDAGLEVGRDVSVIGFDDTTWPEGRRFLTTFREPCYELGVGAAEMLIERMDNGPQAPPQKRKYEPTFVLRRTAGPCPPGRDGNGARP